MQDAANKDTSFFSNAVAALDEGLKTGDLIRHFKPNVGGQEEIFRSNAHVKYLFGANNCGKTYGGLIWDGYQLIPESDKYGNLTGYTINPYQRRRISPGGNQAWLSTYSQDVQKETIQPQFEKILGPYVKESYRERGVLFWVSFEGGSKLNFMWQTQGVDAYTGAKLDSIHFDEPHKEQIYNEALQRLNQKKGYALSTLTPVVDAKRSPLRAADILWYKRKIMDPYDRNPENLPGSKVVFVDLNENSAYVDVGFTETTMAHLSADERRVRRTGRPIEFVGDIPFDAEMLEILEGYLLEHPETSEPEYVRLVHDPGETDDDFQITYRQVAESFPLEPEDGFIIRIWEHPIKPIGSTLKSTSLYTAKDLLDARPGYHIGVDVAAGVKGGDYTNAYVKRDDNGQTVASLHGHLDEAELARQLWLIGWYYRNFSPHTGEPMPATVALEINGIGHAAMLLLLHGNVKLDVPVYDDNAIYRRPETMDIKAGLHIPSNEFGWRTDGLTRFILVSEMRIELARSVQNIQRGEEPLIRDLGWVSEARTFIRDRNGKHGAYPGFFDDRLISSAITNMSLRQMPFTTPQIASVEPKQVEDAIFMVDPEGPTSGRLRVVMNTAEIYKRATHGSPSAEAAKIADYRRWL